MPDLSGVCLASWSSYNDRATCPQGCACGFWSESVRKGILLDYEKWDRFLDKFQNPQSRASPGLVRAARRCHNAILKDQRCQSEVDVMTNISFSGHE